MKPSQQRLLTIESFCQSPSLSGKPPSGLRLSPDGSSLTFLLGRPTDKNYNDLWRLPLTDANGQPVSNPQPSLLVDADRLGLADSDGSELSAEEKGRRERMRLAQSKGILNYYWSSNGRYILLPAGNTLWLYNVSTGELELLPISSEDEKGAVIDAQLSPDSKYITYLREDNNLYLYHLSTRKQISITSDGTPTIRSGVAEFVAQEEMSRMKGYWWSSSSRYLAYTRIDESYVENVTRNEVYANGVRMTRQRYPYAGKRNVRVELCVVDLSKIDEEKSVADESSKIWIPLSHEEGTTDFYLPRVKWVSSGEGEAEVLSYQYESRDQKMLRLKLANVGEAFNADEFASFDRMQVQDGGAETTTDLGALLPQQYISTLLTESEPDAYVNLVGDGDLYFTSKNNTTQSNKIFFWLSERDTGFKSIFMGCYSNDDKEAKLFRLTDTISDASSPFYGQHYVVDSLEFIDEKNRHLYFCGRRNTPIEKHLYRLDFGEVFDRILSSSEEQTIDTVQSCESNITQVTSKKGFHNVIFSTNGDLPIYVDIFCSQDQPPQYSLWSAATDKSDFGTEKNAKFILWVEENNVQKVDHPVLPYYDNLNTSPEFGTFVADDDKTQIWYKLYVPSDTIKAQRKKRTGSDKLPCLVYVYGGPHVQVCSTASSWGDASFFLQYFIQQGFIVLSVDNRGSTARGLEFESSIYLNAGQNEVADQVRGVEKVLLSRDDVDPDRICIYGHSYGGYMSLMCQFRAYRDVSSNKCGFYKFGDQEQLADMNRKPLFLCAVAGAPVSRWDLYDTHYTERYMGIPANEFGVKSDVLDHPSKPFLNVQGYAHSRVHDYVKYYNDSSSKLLMYHGMADDNVLFQHSTEIYKLLIDEGKMFQMLDYPGAKHGMSGEKNKIHLYKSIWEFVRREIE